MSHVLQILPKMSSNPQKENYGKIHKSGLEIFGILSVYQLNLKRWLFSKCQHCAVEH